MALGQGGLRVIPVPWEWNPHFGESGMKRENGDGRAGLAAVGRRTLEERLRPTRLQILLEVER